MYLAAIDPVIEGFLDRGVIGLVFVAVLIGWLAPKWVLDEYRKRESVKDELILKLTDRLDAIADTLEDIAKGPRRG
jgi:hypothetical protein